MKRSRQPCDAGVTVLGVTWGCLLPPDHDGEHIVPMLHAIGDAGTTLYHATRLKEEHARLGRVPGTQMREVLPTLHERSTP